MTQLTPLMIDLKDKKCIIVGGGEVAARKYKTLKEAGALITVISPQLHSDLQSGLNHFTYMNRLFQKGDTRGAFIVVAATDDKSANLKVYEDAISHVPLINVVDQPELCTFTFPSVLRRGFLHIAVSTSGVSPAMSKKIRHQLEEIYGPEYETFLERLSTLRQEIIENIKHSDIRKFLFQELISDVVIEEFKKGNDSLLEQRIHSILNSLKQ